MMWFRNIGYALRSNRTKTTSVLLQVTRLQHRDYLPSNQNHLFVSQLKKQQKHHQHTTGVFSRRCGTSMNSFATQASNQREGEGVGYVGPVAQSIHTKLAEHFAPHLTHLQVLNESHMHKVPKNSETHFKVLVVSSQFEGMSLVQRHRQVNEALAHELQNGVHALSIVAKTPQQWNDMQNQGKAAIDPSPKCRGGDGSLPRT
jgi:BolA-like protein 1